MPRTCRSCGSAVWCRSGLRMVGSVTRLSRLGNLTSSTVSNGENGSLSSASAPLFASLFPERDRTCHLMVHENSDDGQMLRRPLGYRAGRPLSGAMTLQNFIDGGYDVMDAKILVVVNRVCARKTGWFDRECEGSEDADSMQLSAKMKALSRMSSCRSTMTQPRPRLVYGVPRRSHPSASAVQTQRTQTRWRRDKGGRPARPFYYFKLPRGRSLVVYAASTKEV